MMAMVETLRYGEELKLEYKDDGRKEVKDALAEIFALFAYEDPRFSPTAQVMDPSGRAPVAEELNSAILGEWFWFPLFWRLSHISCPLRTFLTPISPSPSRLTYHVLTSLSVSWQILLRGHRASVPAS